MGHFLCGVERESIMLTPIWIVSSAAWNGQAKCRLPISGKTSVNAYACVVYVYNETSVSYCAINYHFCVIRVSFVAISWLPCHWICDSPRTGCAWRLTPTHMWREHAKTKALCAFLFLKQLCVLNGHKWCASARTVYSGKPLRVCALRQT